MEISMRNSIVSIFTIVITMGSCLDLQAADWPMWRHDAAHSAVSQEQLPDKLYLQWQHQLEKPRRAWADKSNANIYFDLSYEPVVAGKLIYVGSMNNDSISAYATESGREIWRYFTDGPVRFAPLVYKSKVYAASDDGFLYCLDAEDGALLWRFRAAPRVDKVLGNDRLISRWPVRGAPVIYDNTLYFAASIWAFEGTFIYALDPESGKEIWCNSGSGTDWNTQQHGTPAFAGVCPQGYLAASDKILLVPSGRAVPGGYDRRSGRFLYWHGASRQFGKGAGGYDVSIASGHFLNGHALYQLDTGKGVTKVPEGILTEGTIFHTEKNQLRLFSVDGKKDILKKNLSVAPGKVFARAGNDLLCGSTDGLVSLVAVSDKKNPEISFQAQVDGPVWQMLAADQKLFVVTQNGGLFCFGAQNKTSQSYSVSAIPAALPESSVSRAVKDYLATKSDKGGYALLVGSGTDEAISAVTRYSRMHVVVVDPVATKVSALRQRMHAQGIYGSRVSAVVADPGDAGLPPYMAELIIVDDSVALSKAALTRLYECLRPYGGTALLPIRYASVVKELQLPEVEITALAEFVCLKRQGPLPGSASWTHQYADAGNSVMSHDDLVKPPFGMLWFGGPPNDSILPRHGHGPSPQVVGGRIFIEGENVFRAMDVYTGRLLWERQIESVGYYYRHTGHHPGANEIGSNYLSFPDAVYLTLPDKCLKLDPASGKTLQEFRLPKRSDGMQTHWGFMNASGKYLVVAASPVTIKVPKRSKAPGSKAASIDKKITPKLSFVGIHDVIVNDRYGPSSKEIYVLNRFTGAVIWHTKANYNFRHNAIVLSKDKLFCIDAVTVQKYSYLKQRGLVIKEPPALNAFDLATGKIVWRSQENVFGTWLGYSAEHDLLMQSGSRNRDRSWDDVGKGVSVLHASDGKLLWQDLNLVYGGPLILYHDQFISNGSSGKGFSLLTGKPLGWRWTRRYGCNTAIASEHLLLFRSSSAAYYDLKNKGGTVNFGGFKSGCTSNMMAADGVLSVPDYTRTCTCSYQNQTSVALIHRPESDAWAAQGNPAEGRLGINLGAEGDRLSKDATYWVEYPLSGSAEVLNHKINIDKGVYFQHHSLLYNPHPKAWITASGVEGAEQIELPVKKGRYTVRLYFAEPDRQAVSGKRIFDVIINGKTVLSEFDPCADAQKPRSTIIKSWDGIAVESGKLQISLKARTGQTLLCGIEAILNQ